MPKLAKQGRFTSGRRKGIDATFKKGVNGLTGLIEKAEVVTLKDNADLEFNKVPQKRPYLGNLFQPSHEFQDAAKNIISSTPHYTRHQKSQHFFGKNLTVFLSPIVPPVNDDDNKKNTVQNVLQLHGNVLNEISSNKKNNLKTDDIVTENDRSQQEIRKSLRLSNKNFDNLNRSNIDDKPSFKSYNHIIKSPDKLSAQAETIKSPSVKRARKLVMSPAKLPHVKAIEKDISKSAGRASPFQKTDSKKTKIPVRTASQDKVKASEVNNNLQANINQQLNKEHATKSTTPKGNTLLSPNTNKRTNKEVRNFPAGKPPEKTPKKEESRELKNLKPNNNSDKESYVINISSSNSLTQFEENDSAYSDSSSDELVHDRMEFVNNTPRSRNIPTISPGKGKDNRTEITPEKPSNLSVGDAERTLINTDLDGTEKGNQNNLVRQFSIRKNGVNKIIQTSIPKEGNTHVEPKDKPKEAESDWDAIMTEIKARKDPTIENENQTSQNRRRKPLVVAHRQQQCILLENPQTERLALDSFDQLPLGRLISNKEFASNGNNPISTEQNNVEYADKMSEEDQREYASILADILPNDDDNQTSAKDGPPPPARSHEVASKGTAVDREIQTSIIRKSHRNVKKLKDPPKEPESNRNDVMTDLLVTTANDETSISSKQNNKKKQQKPRRFTCVDTISAGEIVVNRNTLKRRTTDVKQSRATPKEDESDIMAELKTKETASSNEKLENQILRSLVVAQSQQLSLRVGKSHVERESKGLILDSFDQFTMLHLLNRIRGADKILVRESVGDRKNQTSRQQQNVEKPTEMSEEAESARHTIMTNILAASASDESEISIQNKQQGERVTYPGKISTKGSMIETNIQRSTIPDNTKVEKPRTKPKEDESNRSDIMIGALATATTNKTPTSPKKTNKKKQQNPRRITCMDKILARETVVHGNTLQTAKHTTDVKKPRATPKDDERNWSSILAEIAAKEKRPYQENRRSLFYNRKLFVRSKRLNKYILIEENVKPKELEKPTSQEITNGDDDGCSRDPFSDAGSSGVGSNLADDAYNFVNDNVPIWDVYGDDRDQVESSDGTSTKPLRFLGRLGSDPTRERNCSKGSRLSNHKNFDSSGSAVLGSDNATTHDKTAHHQGEADTSNKKSLRRTRASIHDRKGYKALPVQHEEEVVSMELGSRRKRGRKQNKKGFSTEDSYSDNENTIIPVSSSDQELLGVRPFEKINVVADVHYGANSRFSTRNKSLKGQKSRSPDMLNKDNQHFHNLDEVEVRVNSEGTCSPLRRNKNTPKQRKRKSSELCTEDNNQHPNGHSLDDIEVMADSESSYPASFLRKNKNTPKRRKRQSSEITYEDPNSHTLGAAEVMANSVPSPGINKRQKRVSSKRCSERKKSSKTDNEDINQNPKNSSADAIEVMVNSDGSRSPAKHTRQKKASSNNKSLKEQTKENNDVTKNRSRNKKPQLKNVRQSEPTIDPSNILTTTDGRRPQRNRKPVRLLVDIVVDEATLMKWSEEVEKKEKASRVRKKKQAQFEKVLTPQPGKSSRVIGKGSKSNGNSETMDSAPENKPRNRGSRARKTDKIPNTPSHNMSKENSVENLHVASDEIMQPPTNQEQVDESPERHLVPENKPAKRGGRTRKTDKVPNTPSNMSKENNVENLDIASAEMMLPPTSGGQVDEHPERYLATENKPKKKGGRPRKTDKVPKTLASDEMMQPPTSREQMDKSPDRHLDPSSPSYHKQVDNEPMENERMSTRKGIKRYCTLTSDSGVDTLHTMDNTNKRDLTHSNSKKRTMSKTNANDEQLSLPEEENLPSVHEQSLRNSRLEFATTSTGQKANKNLAVIEQDHWQKELNNSRNFEHSASSSQNVENTSNSSKSSISSIRSEHMNYVLNGEPVSLKFASNVPSETEYSKIGNLYVTQSATLKDILSAGYILLQPGDSKHTTLASKYSFIYNVMKGHACVRCNNRTSIIRQGGFFIIPVGTEYSIRNIDKQAELLMSYTKVMLQLNQALQKIS